jgi:hypothetical protein
LRAQRSQGAAEHADKTEGLLPGHSIPDTRLSLLGQKRRTLPMRSDVISPDSCSQRSAAPKRCPGPSGA